MINPVDRTSELLSAMAAHHKVKNGTVPTKQSSDVEPHAFTKMAVRLTSQILDMQAFIEKCRVRYVDFSVRGMKDEERDQVDSAVAQFIRTAMNQIDKLKQTTVAELQKSPGASFSAHKLGVVVILNENLQSVCRLSETLRGARIKQAIAVKERGSVQYDPVVAQEMARERKQTAEEEDDGIAPLEQQFARENLALVNELVETRERVKEAERTVFEIANLNHVFATKVLEQAREIETLYNLAVESTTYVDRGNRELRKMKQQRPTLKYGLAMLALLLAFSLVFMEWMSRRRSLFFF
ncbi:Syntaxin-18 [Gracilariopsis chorda]|uniref:Syntaxin-18 n=1 Tax=Gracilariopsis chorda TaxID=448386 RepID=A0A2V3J1V3_9FLOR|nr:Syntaxin-18 [Gracilariopsis chorda]|eukprot:PXF47380.1 Syntaxin-18 [Gracilariopsis chorda]